MINNNNNWVEDKAKMEFNWYNFVNSQGGDNNLFFCLYSIIFKPL